MKEMKEFKIVLVRTVKEIGVITVNGNCLDDAIETAGKIAFTQDRDIFSDYDVRNDEVKIGNQKFKKITWSELEKPNYVIERAKE
jgi:hypothetical protein